MAPCLIRSDSICFVQNRVDCILEYSAVLFTTLLNEYGSERLLRIRAK